MDEKTKCLHVKTRRFNYLPWILRYKLKNLRIWAFLVRGYSPWPLTGDPHLFETQSLSLICHFQQYDDNLHRQHLGGTTATHHASTVHNSYWRWPQSAKVCRRAPCFEWYFVTREKWSVPSQAILLLCSVPMESL